MQKTEQSIRWHDFLAAALSLSQIDDRNLRLAFDRLDTDGKGYITLDDFMELMGASHDSENAESVKAIWVDTVSKADFDLDRITYDEFLLLMKGQPVDAATRGGSSQRSGAFCAIPEDEEEPVDEDFMAAFEREDSFRRKYKKMRSRSMDHTSSPKRTSLLSQQHRSIENVITDESKTPLVVHRSLYRAHREMRLAVLEASKQFEENRAKRQQENQGLTLQMRRTSVGGSSSTRKVVVTDQQIDKACHRGGRTRTRRVKTVSDVSGLF